MKTLKLEIPEGYEIDKENSTFENIILKKIEKKLPLSVRDIKGKHWYEALGDVTSEGRANAFLALMQLVELRDAWNGGWSPDYTNWKEKWGIACSNGGILVYANIKVSRVLAFKSRELAEEFLDTFRDLIETAKELI